MNRKKYSSKNEEEKVKLKNWIKQKIKLKILKDAKYSLKKSIYEVIENKRKKIKFRK